MVAAPVLVLLGLGCASPLTGQVGVNQGVANPNLAAEADLVALPHLDEALAKNLVGRRPFLRMAELDAFLAGSLDKAKRAELYVRLFVPINLNTASREEILLVPGVGARMAHEFEEYRPYRALAQFRREIGKYVNPAEVARLEQYVFVPVHLNTASDEDFLSIPGSASACSTSSRSTGPTRASSSSDARSASTSTPGLARLESYVTVD